MIDPRKALRIAALAIPAIATAVAPALADDWHGKDFKCNDGDDDVDGYIEYRDTSVSDALDDKTGYEIVDFWLVNTDYDSPIEKVQLILFCDDLTIKKHNNTDLSANASVNDVSTAAVWEIPWKEGCRLQSETSWGKHYQRNPDSSGYSGIENAGVAVWYKGAHNLGGNTHHAALSDCGKK
ncbi:hypothetical protein [Pseudoruegeria sp. HB172150]|uniref:hypothetical protein n=1 Tax=Pseudoruegeria sp. HB172150 TaxID=2721164 RepID=UPI0015523608|nr:hypothetical protein [Pseudoruegeria sp. HB172150]